jgi:outer membrane cobalamin receptor
MPETVRSIEITRGPFNIECGDSSLGGCINITTKRSEPYASLGASGGSWGTVRGVGTYSSVGGAFEPFMVLEAIGATATATTASSIATLSIN